MRIQSIRINEATNVLTIGEKQLRGVIITTKSWLGKTKEIKAFPTSYGLPGASGRIIFYYFCDEKGNELSMNVSQQINNYLLNQRLMVEENSIKPADRSDAEMFLNHNRDIWNHPRVYDRNEKQSYEVADLMVDFANFYYKKQ